MFKQCLLEPRCIHFKVFKTVYVHKVSVVNFTKLVQLVQLKIKLL